MKLSTALLTVAFYSLPIYGSLSFVSRDQTVLDSNTDLNVPGDNPLVYCEDPVDNILAIEHVNLDPNPPKPYVHPASCYDVFLASECRH